jgi:SOS-response transcriptional repressor LexA
LGTTVLQTIAVCDVDLVHQSHISDEEELRFQMGVAVYGLERDQHNGGRAYRWGEQSLHHRRGVRLRLVNVGASSAIERFDRFGYPVCTVCGQSVSPLSSDRQRDQFEESHLERCGRAVSPIGFYADAVSDALSLPACSDQRTAYSVLEALRFAATRVLDMHMDDLQILVIGHVDRDEVDALLWDPMPGGSGLLDQICERFDEIVGVALEVVEDCPSACATSCIDCLQTFRNGYYHKHLDRMVARERLALWGSHLSFSHEIPVKQPSQEPEEGTHPVNEAERRLRHLLLAAGFEEGVRGEQLRLDRAIGTTIPDVIYRAAHHDEDEGVCIYLDGLSGHLHGNPATAATDHRIRAWLRNNGYEVMEIAASDLYDSNAMTVHFRKLAGYLRADDLRSSLRTNTAWFEQAEAAGPPRRPELRLVQPVPEQRYVGCVPLVPLEAAAGAFGDAQHVEDGDWEEWVEIDTHRSLRPGMFVAKVVGKSMEPGIPDGSYCLFSSPVGGGAREGRTVLVQLRDSPDPETGERYTVKRYTSEKVASDDGTWRHFKITLKPTNPEFEPIILTSDDEGSVVVVAEVLDVIG